jgi:hypothetical protein
MPGADGKRSRLLVAKWQEQPRILSAHGVALPEDPKTDTSPIRRARDPKEVSRGVAITPSLEVKRRRRS